MSKPQEPPITREERKEFKIILIRKGKTIREWAEELGYNYVYILQVLGGIKKPNYLILLIRNFIGDHQNDRNESRVQGKSEV